MHLINIVLDEIEIMHVDVMIDPEKFKIIKCQHGVLFPNQTRTAYFHCAQWTELLRHSKETSEENICWNMHG